jgi:uncharacterized protein (TIGR03437 family)
VKSLSIIFAFVLVSTTVIAADSGIQYSQQGPKLVGNDLAGAVEQGVAVALSADGNTAIVGGYSDSNSIGAAWVYTRSGGAWNQQGSKLVGYPVLGGISYQGIQVALSGDGNTAIVGGDGDNGGVGAAWVFTRSGNTWAQQAKLIGTGAIGNAAQGFRVALSFDGNTALVGGHPDNNFIGAAWVFSRSASSWTQQAKLVGTGGIGQSRQGWSLALSADGNTAILGGAFDDDKSGAVWIFTRSGGVWTQQGNRLIGTGASGQGMQGWSVALSADGNTAAVQGGADAGNLGAMWIFTRSNGLWTQQGDKLVGSQRLGPIPSTHLGQSVALSADGNLAVMGEDVDNNGVGATWVFRRTAGVWTQVGDKLVGTGTVGAAWQGYAVGLSADGNTLIEGGPTDNNRIGAAWIFSANPQVPSAGVVNAASFANGGVVAPGEIIAIFGSGIGPATLAHMQLDSNGLVANSLAQTRVLFDGVAAPLIYVSASQTSAIVPYSVSGKQSTALTVEFQGRSSAAVTLPVTASAPALFTTTASGVGQAAAMNQDGSINGPGNPAVRGSVVVLFGTGEGQTNPAGQDGAIATQTLPKPNLPVSVTIGGKTAQVIYAGAAPMLVAGVIQINVEVPSDITPSPTTPIEITVGDHTSRSDVTLATR